MKKIKNLKRIAMLDESYWENRYKNENTPWDMNVVSPPLKAYIDQLDNKDKSILIPGFGSGHEIVYLESKGFKNVSGIELSKTIIEKLRPKLKTSKLIHDSFFNFNSHFDLIFEQTFFCALEPKLRPKYVEKTHSLLNDNGKLVGLLFNRNFDSGPPFGGSIEEYKNLFKDYFDINVLEECKNSYPGRKEVFINFTKK